MEEEEKESKKSKRESKDEMSDKDRDFYALVGSGAILLFALLFVVFMPKSSKSNDSNNTINKNMYNDYSEFIKEEKLNLFDEIDEMYNGLVTKTRDYGFYFDKDVTIDTIGDEEFLHYILENYVFENKINTDFDLECVLDEKLAKTEKCNVKPYEIGKTSIVSYIKERFDTTKEFAFLNDDSQNYIKGYIPINGLNQAYLYDTKNEKFIFGYLNRFNEQKYIYTNFIKQETDADSNIIIYNQAVVCNLVSISDLYCLKHINDDKTPNNIVFEYKDVEDANSIKEVTYNIKDNERFNSLNKDYVFSNYKLDTYKHTFKKEGNKYYWYSTQIVTE